MVAFRCLEGACQEYVTFAALQGSPCDLVEFLSKLAVDPSKMPALLAVPCDGLVDPSGDELLDHFHILEAEAWILASSHPCSEDDVSSSLIDVVSHRDQVAEIAAAGAAVAADLGGIEVVVVQCSCLGCGST